MAEKVCCPGPIGGNNGNSAGGFREAVCVHTKRFTTPAAVRSACVTFACISPAMRRS